MTTWFSDHYTEAGVDQSSLPVLPATGVPDSSRDGGKVFLSRTSISVTAATTADLFYLMTLKSGDRIHWYNVYADGGWDASTTMSIAAYGLGEDHDGALIQGGLFAPSSFSVATAIDTWDASEIAGAGGAGKGGETRGKMLWERVNDAAAATYALDPLIQMDIVGKLAGANITTVGVMVFEICYTPQGA